MIWVKQEEPWGCGIAALAMITGQSYAQVRKDFEWDAEGDGLGWGSWDCYLMDRGWASQTKYRHAHLPPNYAENRPRVPWPPSPWAYYHLCQVIVSNASQGAHLVVMLRDGSVLDPITPVSKRLTDYHAVHWVSGLFRIPPDHLIPNHPTPNHPHSPPTGGLT